MKDTVPLGRIAGVRVGLHWSAVGIVLLVAIGVGGFQLPALFPGQPGFAYALAGLTSAVLLLVSLLGHEIAHAVVARRNHIGVDGITLWLLGGVARLREEARTPGADLRIAVVGPVASAVLALVFGLSGWGLASLGAGPLLVAVPAYLAVLNLVLAVFNLLPAAPLDGGRVLRSILWRWRGDQHQAAVWSARAGRAFGFLLIAAGIVRLVMQGAEGVWWVLLGWFLSGVAGAEEKQARAAARLAKVQVRDVMSPHVPVAEDAQSAAQFLRESPYALRDQPVVLTGSAGEVRGLLAPAKVRALPPESLATTRLASVCWPSSDVPQAQPDEPLNALLPRLERAAAGRVLVFDAGRLVGIVSRSEVVRAASEDARKPAPGRDPGRLPPPGWWYPGQRR
ncbi:site-2 protease family protein [Saccharopolyspora rectivirgula]|uniref:site-2 protease family protein n=1 Tax=Saccharopolyspora rectivirgula TaxID=28042 RepID=UPI002409E1B4|nr:site-2 protease family protein [Saccharopolyspora rectivirgula]